MESAPVAENTLPPSVLPMLGPSPNQSADSQSSGAVFGRGAGVWVAEALKPLSTTLPPLPTLLTVFPSPPQHTPTGCTGGDPQVLRDVHLYEHL